MATSEVELLKEMATGLEARLTEALEETEAQASRGMGDPPDLHVRRKANGGLQGDAGGAWRSGHPGLDYRHRKPACRPGPGSIRAGCSFQQTGCWERRMEDPGSRQRRGAILEGDLRCPQCLRDR